MSYIEEAQCLKVNFLFSLNSEVCRNTANVISGSRLTIMIHHVTQIAQLNTMLSVITARRYYFIFVISGHGSVKGEVRRTRYITSLLP